MDPQERIISFLTPTTWSGAFLGGIGYLSLQDWLLIGGFVLAAGGFCVNLWFKIQMVKVENDRTEIKRKLAEKHVRDFE